jgi:ATP-dependent DNA helicase RecG
MANVSGGMLLIGVEDNGKVTGSQPRHGGSTDPIKLQSTIFNNTVPNINTRVSIISLEAGPIIEVEVDPYPEPCATMSGIALRRVIGSDVKPPILAVLPP